jgi:hypothetical protein
MTYKWWKWELMSVDESGMGIQFGSFYSEGGGG